MKDAVVILNPHSGKENQDELSSDISKSLSRVFDEVDLHVSTNADDVSNTAQRARLEGVSAVFVVGGDGTLSRAVRGLLDGTTSTEKIPTLGILPGGTGNGFARTLGIPSTIPEALEQLDITQTKPIDIISANKIPFIYTLSGGSLPEGIREVPSKDKARLGFLAYVASEFQRLGNNDQHLLHITVDHKEIAECINSFVAFSSNVLVNLFTDKADAEVDDGQIHMLMLKDASAIALASLVPDALRKSIDDNDNIVYVHGKEIQIECPDTTLRCGMDGDDGPFLPVTLTIQPSRILVFRMGIPSG